MYHKIPDSPAEASARGERSNGSRKPAKGVKLHAISMDPENQPLLSPDALVVPEYPSALSRGNSTGFIRPLSAVLYFFTFLFAASLCYAIIAFSQSLSCLGPPYLYVTHKDSRNIMKYSRDGCLLHEKVLWGAINKDSNLRSMAFGKYQGKDALYVADSNTDQSGIMVFSECYESTSLRSFISRVVSAERNLGAVHAYGVALDGRGNIYASFQDTEVVLRFYAGFFAPIPLPVNLTSMKIEKPSHATNSSSASASNNNSDKESDKSAGSSSDKDSKHSHHKSDNSTASNTISPSIYPTSALLTSSKHPPTPPPSFFDGTFVQFGSPGIHKDGGVRAIGWVKNFTELWVAKEDVDYVIIVDKQGRLLDRINIINPIGILHLPSLHKGEGGAGEWGGNETTHHNSSIVYISSKSNKHSAGAVFAVDMHSRKIVKSFQFLGMKHPTGLAVHGDVLFVADQTRNAIVLFNITTTRVLKSFPLSVGTGDVEQILLSPC